MVIHWGDITTDRFFQFANMSTKLRNSFAGFTSWSCNIFRKNFANDS
jgi:hypothetical protein